MAQVISTPEQRKMILEIIETFRKNQKSSGVIAEYDELIEVFTDALETNFFKGNICETIEDEYAYQMDLQKDFDEYDLAHTNNK